MAPMQKLNGVLSILNWYISSLIPLLQEEYVRPSGWSRRTFIQNMLKIQTEQGSKVMRSRFPFILIWGWALTVWSALTGLDWESKRGLLLGFRNQALASYVVTQSICFIGGMWGGWLNAIKRQNPQHHRCSPIQWPSARRPSKTQLWHRMSDCSRKCFRSAVKVCTGGSRPSVWEWPVLLQGKSNSSAEFGGPMGRDSSPGYSWLNLRQTAGTDED